MKTFAAAIRLVIPDNTAGTALATLNRLGFSLSTLERADVWEFDCPDTLAHDDFLQRVQHIETIFNLNKHRIDAVRADGPGPGEVWIRDIDEGVPADAADVLRQFGPDAAGVRHRTAWRLLDSAAPAAPGVVHRAAETLLCNPAFQKASFAANANPPG